MDFPPLPVINNKKPWCCKMQNIVREHEKPEKKKKNFMQCDSKV